MEQAKRSLLCHAVDPRLGGCLLLGHRGSAKTTLVRGFAAVVAGLPAPGREPEQARERAGERDQDPEDQDPAAGAPFVEVPLGVTEDRLLGSVDAAALVGRNEWVRQRGLLERAHRGVLYVDEINLLPDHVADLLLDSAATGQYRMERDGLSLAVASRYVLVGTMNPEEGELRPQLADRFAHGVRVESDFAASERAEIVRRRLEFEDAPAAFAAGYEAAAAELRARVAAARARLGRVVVGEADRQAVAARAVAWRLEGLRTELAVIRTVRCLAALADRLEPTPADFDEAWTLCLGHRSVPSPPLPPPARSAPPPPSSPPPPARPPSAPGEKDGAAAGAAAPAGATSEAPRGARPEPLAAGRPTREAGPSPLTRRLARWVGAEARRPRPVVPAPARGGGGGNGDDGERVGSSGRGAIRWVPSLLAARRRQTGERGGEIRWVLRREVPARARPTAWIFVDASRSSGVGSFLGQVRLALSEPGGLARWPGGAAWRFSLLVLWRGEIRWWARRAGSRALKTALAGLDVGAGESLLGQAWQQLHRARLRSGTTEGLTLVCSDGMATPLPGEQPGQTGQRLRTALRRLTRGGPPLGWIYPTPRRSWADWAARLARGLPITHLVVGPAAGSPASGSRPG